MQTRLIQAGSILRSAVAGNYGKLAATLKTPPERRALLGRLVNDLQWREKVNDLRRTYMKDISKVTAVIFVVTTATFMMIAYLTLHGDLPNIGGYSVPLALAGTAGLWGSGFSLLAGLRARLDAAELDDLKLMKPWALWSRPLIGLGAAGILYFFLASGLLQGAMFPVLNRVMGSTEGGRGAPVPGMVAKGMPAGGEPEDGSTRALLIIWSFLAGFSERLVPGLLSKTEEGITDKKAPQPNQPGPVPAGTADAGPGDTEAKEGKGTAAGA